MKPTPKPARLALWLLLCAVLGLSATVYTLRRENESLRYRLDTSLTRTRATETELAATEERLYHAESRLRMVEHGVLLPKTLRDALRKQVAEGGNPFEP